MVRKKEREYSGMFEIKAEDINVMLRHLLGIYKSFIFVVYLDCLLILMFLVYTF